MGKKLNVLVTGLNGVVGQALRGTLEKRYNLSALSRSGVSGLPIERNHRADIADFEKLKPAFDNADVVLNLPQALVGFLQARRQLLHFR